MKRSERALSAIVLALATLAGVGASIGLAIPLALLPVDRLQALLGLNFIPPEGGRASLFAWLAGGAVAAVVPAVVLLVRRGFSGAPALSRAAALTSPLLVAALVPQVRAVHFWVERPLHFLVLLTIGLLALERLLAQALAAVPETWTAYVRSKLAELVGAGAREKTALALVLGAASTYAFFAARFSLHRHWRFESAGFDLGIKDNLMWNAMHGEFFRSAIVFPDWSSFLAHHAHFLSILFVPIYALRPGAETLLVLQAIAIGFAALPLYLFARALIPRTSALLVTAAYLLYAPLHGAGSYDFHWLPFSIGLIFWLCWALATERFVAAWVFFALALLVREDVSIGLAALGAFLAVTGARPRFGLAAAIIATAWFAGLKLGVMQAVGGAQYAHHYVDLIAPGEEGFGSVVRTALVNPSFLVGSLLEERKAVFALHVLAPLVFVPLRRPAFLLLTIPGFIVTLMTTRYEAMISISFQYVTHWIPYVFCACVLDLHLAREPIVRRATTLAIFLGVLAHTHPFGACLQHETFVAGFGRSSFEFSEEDRERLERFRAIAARIPPDASVAAAEKHVPHLSTRRVIYTLKIGNPGADYVLVDRENLGSADRDKFLGVDVAAMSYWAVADDGDLALFERGPPRPRVMRSPGPAYEVYED